MSKVILSESSVEWYHADLIQEPLKGKDIGDPVVLVRRRFSDILGSRDEQLIALPGGPVISLFTGCGGMDIGVEQAGFCTVVQHEWDHAACLTLIANRPDFFSHSALIQGDLKKTPTSMLLREAGLRVGEAYIVTGGPPCQGFSTSNSNSHKNKYDARNDLVFEYLRVVRESQPKFFVFENVPGFVSFNGHEYLKAFLKTAYDCYYELVYGLLNAVEYGVPQHRVRFICMGTRRDLFEIENTIAAMPNPQHFSPRDLDRLNILETPLGLFQQEHDSLTRAPGIRYFSDRPLLIPPSPTNGQDRSKTFMNFYDKLEREEPDRIVRDLK